jgi:nucleotide-binding universal stress UspA family protein
MLGAAEPKNADCHVTACIDPSGDVDHILRHAFAVAKALEAPVTLLQILEGQSSQMRPDPIEWDLRHQEARRALGKLASSPDDQTQLAEVQLAEGQAGEAICRATEQQSSELLVLGLHGSHDELCPGPGSTIHHVLHRAPGSLLLVPQPSDGAPQPPYRRILIPMDGSAWAESDIPLAVRIARVNDAEILLAHVIPSPELTEARPLEPADLDLRRQVVERNERAACSFLDRIRSAVTALGLNVRVLCIKGNEVRAALADMITAEQADLVVLSARGHGTGSHGDMPCGNVTAYLMTHCRTPMLIVRTPIPDHSSTTCASIQGLRLPELASA